jgi:hypothetical protein
MILFLFDTGLKKTPDFGNFMGNMMIYEWIFVGAD